MNIINSEKTSRTETFSHITYNKKLSCRQDTSATLCTSRNVGLMLNE